MPITLVSHPSLRANSTIRSVWLKSLLASGIVVGFSASDLTAQGPVAPERSSDDRLALKLQAALAADPQLKLYDLNLLVNVVDGFAVIGGAVPSETLLPRIRSVALAVENIRSAKVSGWISTPDKRDDPFAQRVAELVEGPKPLPKRLFEPPPPLTPSSNGLPPLAIPISTAPVHKEPISGNTVVRRPAPGGLFLDPVVSFGTPAPVRPALAPGAAPLPYPTIPPPGVPTQPVPTADVDIDPRFAELNVQRSGNVATIHGRVRKLDDAWDYADLVQKWPGIDTVVVGAVKVK